MKTPAIFSYIRQHIKTFITFILFGIIFIVVLFLYNLPVEPVLYSAVLCIIIGIILFILDFIHYYRKHRLLYQLQKQVTLSIDDLPQAKSLLEKDYQELIQILFADKTSLVSGADAARNDLIDYYTLWVHQIKTPISAMRLLLQTEENTQNSELSMELFKIEQYVEMVLQYLRLDSYYSDLVIKKYNLDEIVRQAVRKYAKIFIGQKISLNYEELNCQVLTDEKWLVFVIEQLLSNALKYTKEGSISIYMEGKDNNTLVIEDTGIGIAPEDLPRVFEKGYTGYNGHADKKSTGIGLYLCKRIIKNLSHTIEIESQVGNGTKVKICLDHIDIRFE
ncbi:sensor histidine kinase [Anaerocolumna sp.]|uniref:sensor histidine kinase n=1 Tax=Anaerocolumna sp. TaxID=2041569 RepID=UPI0028A6EFCB|nr:sensor histidine kinase [Anaerocolumna sp.]